MYRRYPSYRRAEGIQIRIVASYRPQVETYPCTADTMDVVFTVIREIIVLQ